MTKCIVYFFRNIALLFSIVLVYMRIRFSIVKPSHIVASHYVGLFYTFTRFVINNDVCFTAKYWYNQPIDSLVVKTILLFIIISYTRHLFLALLCEWMYEYLWQKIILKFIKIYSGCLSENGIVTKCV